MSTEREVVWAPQARRDFQLVLRRTLVDFGRDQVLIYQAAIEAAADALRSTEEPRDSRAQGTRYRRLSVRRQGRRGSHILFYRPTGPDRVEIVRIPHERQDFDRHLPPEGQS